MAAFGSQHHSTQGDANLPFCATVSDKVDDGEVPSRATPIKRDNQLHTALSLKKVTVNESRPMPPTYEEEKEEESKGEDSTHKSN